MQKLIKICIAVALTAWLISPSQAAIGAGEPVPNFSAVDANGEKRELSEFDGKWVILEWINFDCPFVKKHYGSGNMPAIQQKMSDEGVVWLSVNSSAKGKQGYFEGQELLDRIKKEGWQADAYLIDADGEIGRMFGARTTPHMYIISPDRKLVYQGAIDSIRSANPADIEKADNYVMLAYAAAASGKVIAKNVTEPYGCSVKY